MMACYYADGPGLKNLLRPMNAEELGWLSAIRAETDHLPVWVELAQ
mgnify:CR=1 FL=1